METLLFFSKFLRFNLHFLSNAYHTISCNECLKLNKPISVNRVMTGNSSFSFLHSQNEISLDVLIISLFSYKHSDYNEHFGEGIHKYRMLSMTRKFTHHSSFVTTVSVNLCNSWQKAEYPGGKTLLWRTEILIHWVLPTGLNEIMKLTTIYRTRCTVTRILMHRGKINFITWKRFGVTFACKV